MILNFKPEDHGWVELPKNKQMIKNSQRRFQKDEIMIDVWESGTIGFIQFRKQRFKRNLPKEDIFEIFIDPNYFESI